MPEQSATDALEQGRGLVSAIEETWSSLREACVDLDDAGWSTATACPGWDVHDNLAHIIAIEQMLEGDALPEVALPETIEHVKNDFGRVNEMWVEFYRPVEHSALLDLFDATTARRLQRLNSLDAAGFTAPSWTPQGEGTVLDLLPFRIFDAWCHEQDIRAATGRPGGWNTAAAGMAVDRMVNALPFAVGKRAGMSEGFTLAIHLTGDHSRDRVVAVSGGRAGFADVADDGALSITMPTRTFLGFALGRTVWSEAATDVVVTGDHEAAERVLRNLNVLF